MSKTRRLSYRLHEGEALVVGPIENFENLVQLYEGLSRLEESYTPAERQVWAEMAEWVTEWLGKTAQTEGYE